MGLLTMRDQSLEAASVFGAWVCLRIALAAFLGWHSANLRGFLWKPSTRTSPKLKKIEGSRNRATFLSSSTRQNREMPGRLRQQLVESTSNLRLAQRTVNPAEPFVTGR